MNPLLIAKLRRSIRFMAFAFFLIPFSWLQRRLLILSQHRLRSMFLNFIYLFNRFGMAGHFQEAPPEPDNGEIINNILSQDAPLERFFFLFPSQHCFPRGCVEFYLPASSRERIRGGDTKLRTQFLRQCVAGETSSAEAPQASSRFCNCHGQ